MKLSLKDDEGKMQEYFIIPMKTPNRALMLRAESDPEERKVWNEKTRMIEDFWK